MTSQRPRPRIGAEIRVLPTLTRTFLDPDRPPESDPHAGEHGIVIGYDHPAPTITRDAAKRIGETTWDLEVAFLGGRGSVYDIDEVEVLYDASWTRAAPAGNPSMNTPEQPFDHDAAERVTAYLDVRDDLIARGATLTDQIAEGKSGGLPWAHLLAADVREVLRQRAYAKDENVLLAEKCGRYRSELDAAHAIIQRVTTQMQEYAKYGIGRVNVRLVLNLLSPTWPDGNDEATTPPADGSGR